MPLSQTFLDANPIAVYSLQKRSLSPCTILDSLLKTIQVIFLTYDQRSAKKYKWEPSSIQEKSRKVNWFIIPKESGIGISCRRKSKFNLNV